MGKWTYLLAVAALLGAATFFVQADAEPQPAAPTTEAADTRPAPLLHPGRHGHRRQALTEQQEQELLRALKDKKPSAYERLMRLKDRDPRGYRRLLSGSWFWYQRWKGLPKEVQEAHVSLHGIRVRIWRTVRAFRETDDEKERARLRRQLRGLVSQRFDSEQVIRAHDIKSLEQRIERLKEALKGRLERREEVIEEEVSRLLSPSRRRPPPPPRAGGGEEGPHPRRTRPAPL
jgi:Spy/CpxP family protein refolding chaperone